MAAATKASTKAARERKQKIFVAVGGLVLLLLVALQLPKLLGGSETSAAASTETTTVGETTPGETTSSPTTSAPTSTPTSTPVALVDTDRPLPVGPGQFRSFSVFNRKDPFVQGIETDGDPSTGGAGTSGSSGGTGTAPGTPPKDAPPSQGFTVDGTTGAGVTVISVNGARHALKPGAAFPAADPVFVLVAENPARKTAIIGVVGGAYAGGARTTRLKVGKPVILVNTSTGARYRVVLVAVGSGSAFPTTPAPTAPTTPTAPAAP
jgi:hypothetical protein